MIITTTIIISLTKKATQNPINKSIQRWYEIDHMALVHQEYIHAKNALEHLFLSSAFILSLSSFTSFSSCAGSGWDGLSLLHSSLYGAVLCLLGIL